LTGGVEKASTFNISFDPSYESITLHQLAIYRDGSQVDAFLPGNARILQRELGLEQQIYDGSLSLMIIFSNVKTGDIIEIAYTRKGRNPVYSGHFDMMENFSYSEKVEKFSSRCVRSRDRKIYFKTYNASSALEEQILDDSQIETSYVVFPCKVLENFNTPNWYMPHEFLQFSDFQSWQEVSAWGKKLFQSDDVIEIDEIKTLVSQWKGEGKETKTALATAALDFVQNEIRYLGIEEGIYSHQPHAPQATLSNGYGDCKDKTALLKVFMDEIGIASVAALVSTIHTSQIKDFLPSTSIFNHVILSVKIDDEFYWLDPTAKYQAGPLKNRSKLFYGSYLLLNGEKECLVSNAPISNPCDVDLESHYIFQSSQCELKIKTIFKQEKANEYRSFIAHYGKEGIAKRYHDYFSRNFGSVCYKEPVSLLDDLDLNQITILENYVLEDVDIKKAKFPVPLYILPSYLPDQIPPSRKEPLSLVYPMKISESVRISPSDKDVPSTDPESISLQHPSFSFDLQLFEEDHDIVCKYIYQTKADHILPEDFGSLRKVISEVNENLMFNYQEKSDDEDLKSLGSEFAQKNSKGFFNGWTLFLLFAGLAQLVRFCTQVHH
jgi:hypothetical protein